MEISLLGCSVEVRTPMLCSIFSRLRVPLNLTLLVIHINHQIRGAESDADEDFVKQLCQDLNILGNYSEDSSS